MARVVGVCLVLLVLGASMGGIHGASVCDTSGGLMGDLSEVRQELQSVPWMALMHSEQLFAIVRAYQSTTLRKQMRSPTYRGQPLFAHTAVYRSSVNFTLASNTLSEVAFIPQLHLPYHLAGLEQLRDRLVDRAEAAWRDRHLHPNGHGHGDDDDTEGEEGEEEVETMEVEEEEDLAPLECFEGEEDCHARNKEFEQKRQNKNKSKSKSKSKSNGGQEEKANAQRGLRERVAGTVSKARVDPVLAQKEALLAMQMVHLFRATGSYATAVRRLASLVSRDDADAVHTLFADRLHELEQHVCRIGKPLPSLLHHAIDVQLGRYAAAKTKLIAAASDNEGGAGLQWAELLLSHIILNEAAEAARGGGTQGQVTTGRDTTASLKRKLLVLGIDLARAQPRLLGTMPRYTLLGRLLMDHWVYADLYMEPHKDISPEMGPDTLCRLLPAAVGMACYRLHMLAHVHDGNLDEALRLLRTEVAARSAPWLVDALDLPRTHKAVSISPSVPSLTKADNAVPSQEERSAAAARLRKQLEAAIYPPSCSDTFVLVYKPFNYGLGAEIHAMYQALNMALDSNRTFVVDPSWIYGEKTNTDCQAHPRCYFRHTSYCSSRNDSALLRPTHYYSGPDDARRVVYVDSSFFTPQRKPLKKIYQWHIPAAYRRFGRLWYKSQLVSFLVQPTTRHARAMRSQKAQLMDEWSRQQQQQRNRNRGEDEDDRVGYGQHRSAAMGGTGLAMPYIGVHVRLGDKHAEMPRHELSEYLATAYSISRVTGIRSVWVASDHPRIDQYVTAWRGSAAREMVEAMDVRTSRAAQDAGFLAATEGYAYADMHSNRYNNTNAAMATLFDAHMLAQSSHFVGTFSSNFGALVLELMYYRTNGKPMAISLDTDPDLFTNS